MTTAPKPRRTQEERRTAAERSIIDAAIGIIAQRGLSGLTLAAAGEAAGYSRGIAGHHFGKKDDLLVAIVRQITARFGRNMERTSPAGNSGLPRLVQLVNLYLTGVKNDPTTARALHMILSEAVNSPALAPALAAANERSVAGIEKTIRDGIASGEIRADLDPHAQAVLVLAGLRGVLAQWLLDDSLDLDLMRKTFADSLERSLKA